MRYVVVASGLRIHITVADNIIDTEDIICIKLLSKIVDTIKRVNGNAQTVVPAESKNLNINIGTIKENIAAIIISLMVLLFINL